jgi:Ca2+/H+ antiporter, TMEM165/GDT1 family
MFEAFVAGLLLITISELGDKTFFIAVIMATRQRRSLVFIGVVAALAAMTVISVLMGQIATVFPPQYIRYAEIGLFLAFGFNLLFQGWRMADAPCDAVCEEAVEAIAQAEIQMVKQPTSLAIILQTFGLTFLAEWGDRTQIATIGLAASKDAIGVMLGAILGHAICAAIAVVGGKLIAGRISEKVLTLTGGVLFLVFALLAIANLGREPSLV